MPLVYFSTVFFHSSSSWCGRLIYIHKRTDREQSLTPSIIEHSPFHFFPWLSMRPWDMAQQSLIKAKSLGLTACRQTSSPGWWSTDDMWRRRSPTAPASSSVIPTEPLKHNACVLQTRGNHLLCSSEKINGGWTLIGWCMMRVILMDHKQHLICIICRKRLCKRFLYLIRFPFCCFTSSDIYRYWLVV